jgi:hypothetical protein
MKFEPVKTRFRAFGVPAKRMKYLGAEVKETPNWARLKKHIAAHEKAGGRVAITLRPLKEPARVEGWLCVEFADVVLDWS